MLSGPVPADSSDGRSATDRLIGLVLDSGIEVFHDPDQHGWASIRIDGHFENHPIRSRHFQLFLLRTYYRETVQFLERRRSTRHMTCSRLEPCSTASRLRFISAPPSMRASCTWISAIERGEQSKSVAKAGEYSHGHQ